MRIAIPFALAAILLGLSTPGTAASVEEKRAEMRQTAGQALERLYKLQPRAKAAVEKSAGYAVFSNFGMKLLVAGGGQGQGMAVDRKSGKEIFMKMAEVQAGLGFGVKKFQLIWIFETKSALRGDRPAGGRQGRRRPSLPHAPPLLGAGGEGPRVREHHPLEPGLAGPVRLR